MPYWAISASERSRSSSSSFRASTLEPVSCPDSALARRFLISSMAALSACRGSFMESTLGPRAARVCGPANRSGGSDGGAGEGLLAARVVGAAPEHAAFARALARGHLDGAARAGGREEVAGGGELEQRERL